MLEATLRNHQYLLKQWLDKRLHSHYSTTVGIFYCAFCGVTLEDDKDTEHHFDCFVLQTKEALKEEK